MSLLAEVHLAHPDLALTESLETAPDAKVSLDIQPRTDSEESMGFVTVTSDDFAAVESAIVDDDTVTDLTLIEDEGDRRVYRIALRSSDLDISADAAKLGVWIVEIHPDSSGWTLELHVSDRETIRRFRECCEDRGIELSLDKLYTADSRVSEQLGLSDAQLETLIRAYRAGYFETPRRISQGELADELGISGAAVSYRLRRGIAELVHHTLLDEYFETEP